ncbi:glycoside hydrolase family 99-like domain-containing protein [Vibrio sp. 10N.261.46.E12]|uniref:glycoside hydrolase family 99-like domain-containing protein n=1 Tax=unclassified Vibrio TaxID=2614977 RepID=UPI000975586F|nr:MULTISPECIES: glycoside hydrolase family 99-like domain-containing protein [unclassified Vibrio]OMO32564.1 hypothetical protein BH584_16265 [Vibrio sp. 10N.261.45.E1]PMJ26042.1 hypothetical protein BCU27_00780 [Vibrio sp. 10N.286.45.B6]PML89645.1 hypothetical protein BCT66_07240 [Vibrio sp. 10N.261.49.E11]PMM69687.1 hypothetical protein BCT48_09865 [Vibrio sp. 10N.261.46.F12]PMM90715.1 hypothetical protein BCT46_01050 [Vibrio sp. 10N.261.46.E8]
MNVRKLIVVLGMHRSGTSAITKSLQTLGVGLGTDLYAAGADNPKGFWEDVDCLAINEKLLSILGSAHDHLAFSWTELESNLELQDLKRQAIDLINRKLDENGGIWGFKDPRTCRLLSFWQDVFKNIECDVSYVIAIRNPLSVADSLLKRNQMAKAKSHVLWLQHTIPSLELTHNTSRVIVDYDNLMKEPYPQIVRLAGTLSMAVPSKDSQQVSSFINDFIDEDLRHTEYTLEDLKNNEDVPLSVYQFYSFLNKQSCREENVDVIELNKVLTGLRLSCGEIKPLTILVESLEQEIGSLSAELLLVGEDKRDLTQKIHELEAKLLNLNEEYEGLKSINSELNVSNENYERAIQSEKKQNTLILNSRSWRVTKPLRNVSAFFSDIREQFLSYDPRSIWHRLPISTDFKIKLKSAVFETFPFVFRNTDAYKAWYNMNHSESNDWTIANTSRITKDFDSSTYVSKTTVPCPSELPVKLIAFYLPQFHEIPENNEWWGDGFTEWTNVKSGQPLFEGHYQPHVPDEDIGYYNLLDSKVQQQQIEMAKLYGVGGFCFYYYWFGGKRLLEQPIENYLENKELDHPFCLCWANENWCRRWDGRENEILISQDHSCEDDIAFAADVARYMRDSRYIRIDDKPLLVVYRPSLLPSAKKTVKRWRNYFRENGIGEVYIAYTQSFERFNPKRLGFDAAIEFPPNNSTPPNITNSVKPLNSSFSGNVFDWSIFLKRSRKWNKPVSYRLFRSVCPSWDNTARRKNNSTIFAGSNPADYQKWLENAVQDTCDNIENPDERLVFVNAWNEWAEGAHLEPDLKYGYAWLEATRKALTGELDVGEKKKIVVVSHDAHPHGAQFLALGLVRSLALDFKFEVHTVFLGGGKLKSEFQKYSQTHSVISEANFDKDAIDVVKNLKTSGVCHAIVNTTVSGKLIKYLSEAGIDCLSLIHEMPNVIKQYSLEQCTLDIVEHASKVVFPAEVVADGFSEFASLNDEKKVIRPQGLWRRIHNRHKVDDVRRQVRDNLGVRPGTKIVLAVGYGDHRKGPDLFARVGLEILESYSDLDVLFVWIGHWDSVTRSEVDEIIKDKERHFKFLGYEPNTEQYHLASDVFALTSREDPFPNVVLESFDAGVPVVAFEGSGGAAKLVGDVTGLSVPMGDVKSFSNTIATLLREPTRLKVLKNELRNLVDNEYSFRNYIFNILEHLNLKLPRVSVIVPNYNYGNLIKERLDSILKQTMPFYELIILDDMSNDNSLEEIQNWIKTNQVECKLIVNEENSGSVFNQWYKGSMLAKGDLIWIAEADDLALPNFLKMVVEPFNSVQGTVLSYCDSIQIDQEGRVLAGNYYEYTKDLSDTHWLNSFSVDGYDEVSKYLAIKNTIPNASGVVFKSDVLQETLNMYLDDIKGLSNAGDWLIYAMALKRGKLAFEPTSMNKHRRHNQSKIGSENKQSLVREIEQVQRLISNEFDIADDAKISASKYISHLKQQFRLVE